MSHGLEEKLHVMRMVFLAARLLETFRRNFPSRDHLLNGPALVAHPLQIIHQRAARLNGQCLVVVAAGKIPRGIAPLPGNLALDFAQRIFQLFCDALQKRGAGVIKNSRLSSFRKPPESTFDWT